MLGFSRATMARSTALERPNDVLSHIADDQLAHVITSDINDITCRFAGRDRRPSESVMPVSRGEVPGPTVGTMNGIRLDCKAPSQIACTLLTGEIP